MISDNCASNEKTYFSMLIDVTIDHKPMPLFSTIYRENVFAATQLDMRTCSVSEM
ncbi:MAG: hypothetical protein LBV69_09460 [Bacteroidales bacterium]|nr:hypothetical protein [Bacteroidales bacterium]